MITFFAGVLTLHVFQQMQIVAQVLSEHLL